MKKIILGLYKFRLVSAKTYAKNIGVKYGNGCDFQYIHFPSEPYLIEIGDNVQITSGVRLYTHSGGWVIRQKYENWDTFGKIKIGSNVYIGNGAMIMPGVLIGDNVMVGAGSVVTKSIPNNVIVAGNPAKVISSIENYIERNKIYNLQTGSKSFKEKENILKKLPQSSFMKKNEIK